MFDEPSHSGGAGAPQNLPIEPDDMFSGVDAPSTAPVPEEAPNIAPGTNAMTGGTDALGAGVLKRKGPAVNTPAPAAQPSFSYGSTQPTSSFSATGGATGFPTKEPVLGRIILFVLSGLIIVGLAVGGWWVYSNFFKKAPSNTGPQTTTPPTTPPATTPPQTTPTPPAESTTSGISNDIKNDTVLFGESVDTDRDGLDDRREEQVGTSVTISDTDKDGVTDGEEVLVWKTNPLNADTDGDGFLDGDEIQHGYNPLGPGKLPAGQTSPAVNATSSITP